MAEEHRATSAVRPPPWKRAEMGDAGAVFLAAFGLLVFGQLALGFAGGSAVIGPAGAARIAGVALLGGAVTALGWELEQQRRARGRAVRRWWRRKRRGSVDTIAETVETSAEPSDAAEVVSDPESTPEPTPPAETASRPATGLWAHLRGWFGG